MAEAGDGATAWVRGGPPFHPVALELVAVDGVPVGQLVIVAAFDRVGEWSVTDTVPAGLEGTTIELRGWGIDGRGKLASSPVQALAFE